MSEELSPAIPNRVEQLATQVLQCACDRHFKLATAESCTGGLLASLLTDVEGCSHAFERGFVVYSDAAKQEMLGIPQRILNDAGAVSKEAAFAMAEGGLRYSHADICVAITGFAGPGGPESTPGLVHIAVARRQVPTLHWCGEIEDSSRGGVRLASIEHALELVWEQLQVE
ncbi:MAG: CinA family protein [Spongiibacteraceae bacterium]|jgi:nicotinamide-nucleotide amidase|nr:CinA family protein [Spongiibacteraceae bacterium]